MDPKTTCRCLALGLVVSVGSLAPAVSRCDVVDASSSTLLIVRDQWRDGTLFTIAPLYELLSVSARDVTNPVADDLQLVFSGWGALSIGHNLVWYDRDPPEHRVFADLDLAFVQGELLKRSVKLRVGRQLVAGGVTGSLQLDGGSALVRLPLGFGVSAYVGSPVTQRFDARGTEATFNPQRGTFAVGGRAYWTLPPWGELGFSGVDIKDRGDPSRQQIGADLRLTPWTPLTLFANTSYDVYEARWVETKLLAQLRLLSKLLVSADYRHVDPDLFLSRSSLLAVFVVDRRNEAGGGVQLGPWRAVTVFVDYHHLSKEDGEGHRATGRATWRPGPAATLGAEIGFESLYNRPSGSYLNNGYYMARAFGSKALGRISGTLDLQEYAFQQPINGHDNSFLATATAAYELGSGFSALVSGTAGATPYYARHLELLAKLSYNQSYQLREVRR